MFPLQCEHTTQVYTDDHRHVFVRDALKYNLVPPRRQQERKRMRIHGPLSLSRPRRRASVSSLLALKIRPPSWQRHISNPRR